MAWDENERLVGRTVELLVAEGEGRKDGATHRLSGRAPDNRLVHFTPRRQRPVAPATWSTVEVTYAAPHHLVADAPVSALRRTRAGDAWEAAAGEPRTRAGRPARHAHGPLARARPCLVRGSLGFTGVCTTTRRTKAPNRVRTPVNPAGSVRTPVNPARSVQTPVNLGWVA